MGAGFGCGCSAVGAGGGPKSGVVKYRLCVLESSAMVLAPYSVFTVSTSLYLSGVSSWKMWTLPSRVETKISPVSGSNTFASAPRTDGKRLDHLAIVRVQDHQLLRVAARRKKPPVLAVHGQGSRLSRRRHRPPRLHRQRAGIDRHHLILVLNVVVDHSFVVSDCELRPTSQRNTLHHRPLRPPTPPRPLRVAFYPTNVLP